MKKLFTLFAFLACFLGANAIEIEDAKVDFSQYSDISEWGFPNSWGGSQSARDRLSIVDGCLHFESTEATDPSWDCQFFPIGCTAEEGVTYTLHFKIKGDHTGNVSMLGFGLTPYGQFQITDSWVEGTVTYEAASSDGNILMQCGDWVGTWDIAYLRITHEGREEKPVDWMNILENGDAEGVYGDIPCAQSKEFGVLDEGQTTGEWIHPAEIVDDPDGNSGQGKVFHSQSQIVNPVIMDGDNPGAANTWQNQFWIVFPRPLLGGEGYKVSFKYKASEAVRVSTQAHTTPGNYLGGGFGDVNFTTSWQTFESKELTAASSGTYQSIAFQFGEDQAYLKSIDFYFDDIKIEVMNLKEGFFAAGIDTNTDANWNTFNFDNAVEFEWDQTLGAYVGVVGTEGNQDSWVNQVMVSTKYGNDKGFKANTVKVTGRVQNDPDQWLPYSAAAKASINLPARGVWKIAVDTNDEVMNFTKIEGEKDAEPVDIAVNANELVVNALERQPNATEQPADDEAGTEAGTGQPWDSQFWIVANRTLKAGEETVVEFDYVSSLEAAHTSTQVHAPNFSYLNYEAIGDVDFTNVEQHFSKDFTIPAGDDGMESIVFNMAEIKAACVYTIKNVKWYLKDADLNPENQTMENLINAEGTSNFFLKEGAGYGVHQVGTDPIPPTGIQNVTTKSAKTSNAIYNIAGQRVNNDYKGLVIKDGKKFVK